MKPCDQSHYESLETYTHITLQASIYPVFQTSEFQKLLNPKPSRDDHCMLTQGPMRTALLLHVLLPPDLSGPKPRRLKGLGL